MPSRKVYHAPRAPKNVLGIMRCACGAALSAHRVEHAYAPPRRSYGDTSAPCVRCGLRFAQHRPKDPERERARNRRRVRDDVRIEHPFAPGGGITDAGAPRCDRCGRAKQLHRKPRPRKQVKE